MKVDFQQRTRYSVYAILLAAPLFGGCASTVDTMTGQRFKHSPFHTMFHSEDPLDQIKNSPEADVRAQAMLSIKEPKRSGGSEKEQFEVLQLLATSATSDKQPPCRLNAIEALGRFEDPRTSAILVTAYQTAGQEAPAEMPPTETGVVAAGRRTRSGFAPVSSFTGDTIVTIQCRALESLGKKRTPEALALLCQVASTPAKREAKPTEIDALIANNSGQDQFDLRLAAIRSLENFKGDSGAAHTLYRVMNTEHDVALKNRAHQSLMKVTGQSYAPNAPEWRAFLKLADAGPVHQPIRANPAS